VTRGSTIKAELLPLREIEATDRQIKAPMTASGHEDAFPAAKRNGRCRIRKRSVAADDLGCVNFSVRLFLNWTTPPGLFKK
jgi:hypothetical protein